MGEQDFQCGLIVEGESINPLGLERVWPQRINRRLVPVSYGHISDGIFLDLANIFKEVSSGKETPELMVARYLSL